MRLTISVLLGAAALAVAGCGESSDSSGSASDDGNASAQSTSKPESKPKAKPKPKPPSESDRILTCLSRAGVTPEARGGGVWIGGNVPDEGIALTVKRMSSVSDAKSNVKGVEVPVAAVDRYLITAPFQGGSAQAEEGVATVADCLKNG